MKTKEGKRLEACLGKLEVSRNICSKTGTIKDIKSRDLVDTEEIKRRWEEYIQELYKKDRDELDDCNGVVSHPEPDILESKVK